MNLFHGIASLENLISAAKLIAPTIWVKQAEVLHNKFRFQEPKF